MAAVLERLCTYAKAMRDIYDSDRRPTEVAQVRNTAALLYLAFRNVRNDPIVGTMPIVRNALAILHGRWVRHYLAAEHSDDRPEGDLMGEIRGTLWDIQTIANYPGNARILQVPDHPNDLLAYNQLLSSWYGERPFPSLSNWNVLDESNTSEMQDTNITLAALNAALDAVDRVGFAGGDPLADILGESSPSPTTSNTRPVAQANGDGAFRPMHSVGDRSNFRSTVEYPAGPAFQARSHHERLSAQMILDLLKRLPCGEAARFENQIDVLDDVVVFQGMALHAPFTNADFCCEPCQHGFDELDHFIQHLHRHHFLSVSQFCRCQICLVVYGQYKSLAPSLLHLIQQQWESELTKRSDPAIPDVTSLPGLPTIADDGKYVAAQSNNAELSNVRLQNFALEALWGVTKGIYGRDEPIDSMLRTVNAAQLREMFNFQPASETATSTAEWLDPAQFGPGPPPPESREATPEADLAARWSKIRFDENGIRMDEDDEYDAIFDEWVKMPDDEDTTLGAEDNPPLDFIEPTEPIDQPTEPAGQPAEPVGQPAATAAAPAAPVVEPVVEIAHEVYVTDRFLIDWHARGDGPEYDRDLAARIAAFNAQRHPQEQVQNQAELNFNELVTFPPDNGRNRSATPASSVDKDGDSLMSDSNAPVVNVVDSDGDSGMSDAGNFAIADSDGDSHMGGLEHDSTAGAADSSDDDNDSVMSDPDALDNASSDDARVHMPVENHTPIVISSSSEAGDSDMSSDDVDGSDIDGDSEMTDESESEADAGAIENDSDEFQDDDDDVKLADMNIR